jgi:hypothetical protein
MEICVLYAVCGESEEGIPVWARLEGKSRTTRDDLYHRLFFDTKSHQRSSVVDLMIRLVAAATTLWQVFY